MTNNKFESIYETLRHQIQKGVYARGDHLPSENQLVTMYNASRETIRKSLNLLVREGMIQKIRGKGSVVIYGGMTEFHITKLSSFKEVQKEMDVQYETKVVSLKCIEAREVPKVQAALELSGSDKLWYLLRYRKFHGEVKIMDEDYLVYDLMPGLTETIAAQSIYGYIEDDLNHEISFSQKEITFEVFGEQEYEAFGNVTPNYSATVRGIVHLSDTTKFQYNISKHLATEFKFTDFSRRRR
ncbi:trehalose operon repressor [Staphylococcus massiliensis]|uniref:Trehalose operon repressor n=1 Tax=Staphylococcus massiliensis S46 TaxID=1229783 RepID=K9B0A3_9STAP|nr:trehalose operon repressor [Staphylococcus massiliensis]EKU48242.1 trehalose operon transcriptional repressor [Staphylococcus massiliensis S46]MCG3399497.1 trehalose operon repressor [Staphylococcus massiliensis]MCG3402007.1 trehalose operon repressor [Staphylococcus massiliensis]MCG3412764.1 trehalose operon repressor [Staphylococcus massiliensis]POA00254.1 trehalose operon repressor [Staphylococcus massiliensis CCUG 55927]